MKIYLFFLLIVLSCNKKEEVSKYNYQNLSGQEKSQKAIEIAEEKFNEVYGKETMAKEQPLKAKKINDSVWFVEGTFDQGVGNLREGGVAFGEIDIKNNKIIKYSHGK